MKVCGGLSFMGQLWLRAARVIDGMIKGDTLRLAAVVVLAVPLLQWLLRYGRWGRME